MRKSKRYSSFSALINEDADLKAVRLKYAGASPRNRRKAAEWEYDASIASDMFNRALLLAKNETFAESAWPPGFLALAIDPLYAPALLTVGSSEYQHRFVKKAMELFLTLTTLPEDEEDLAVIIDKAGDFLLDYDDYNNALQLYLAAEKAYPGKALFYIGSGYCLGKLGKTEQSIGKHRKADELEPDNYRHLNDLGYSLLEAGQLEDAEILLKRSASLAPPEYEFARNNLELLSELRGKKTPLYLKESMNAENIIKECLSQGGDVVEFQNNSDGKYDIVYVKNGSGFGCQEIEFEAAVQIIDELRRQKGEITIAEKRYHVQIKECDSFGNTDYGLKIQSIV